MGSDTEKTIEIRRVEKGTGLARELLAFVEREGRWPSFSAEDRIWPLRFWKANLTRRKP